MCLVQILIGSLHHWKREVCLKSWKCLVSIWGVRDIGRVKLDEYLRDKNDSSKSKFTGAWHHMGTTRMSSNEKTGVVDANCKVHGVNNLFIAGSSCFATSGYANPTLTLVALSLRLSAFIKSENKSKT